MVNEGMIVPYDVTITIMIVAYVHLGATGLGKHVHFYLIVNGNVERSFWCYIN